ncbi:MAG TPA: GNAT family N-acetyltransferase, partial [Candidatus Bathyarchaeota archaeon]|nr:GNAT family N-acetyltransferase [Candidatus Bathyarchaeota archaeon]
LPRPKTYTFINLQMEDEHLIKAIFEKLKGLKFKVKTFIDMATDEEHFTPIIRHEVKKLTIDNLKDLLELRKVEGRLVTERTVAETLRMQRCYGIFENGKLVSVAHTYVRLPEIWVVGGVYTRPEYRGRGYATSVTSAVTRDAVQSGAVAMLHVAEDNPAYRIYERIGYREIARKKWIIVQ